MKRQMSETVNIESAVMTEKTWSSTDKATGRVVNGKSGIWSRRRWWRLLPLPCMASLNLDEKLHYLVDCFYTLFTILNSWGTRRLIVGKAPLINCMAPSPLQRPATSETSQELKRVRERETELKRSRGEISCAECRRYVLQIGAPNEQYTDFRLYRLKLRCDKKVSQITRL